MPRKKNLDLAEEINGEEIDVTEDEANEANTMVAPPVPVTPPAPSPVVNMTVADIQGIVKAAVEAAQSGNQQIASIVTQGIAQARKPIPEQTDADYHRISAFNPLGDRDHPRPGLKCEVYIGTREPKSNTVQRSYGFLADDLTVYEQIALNTLEPMKQTIKLLDDSPLAIEIVGTRDEITGALTRMVIMVPLQVIQKGSQSKNLMPGICNLVAQLTGKDYTKLSHEDLAYLMAEHRKGNYISEREPVAA